MSLHLSYAAYTSSAARPAVMCGFRFTRSVWSTALGFSVMMVLDVAIRQNDIAFEVRDYLKSHPNAAVVNLGCGLDSTGMKLRQRHL